MVIALDGGASSGKSTISKHLAKELKICYLNTGMIFRSIALFLHNKQIDSTQNAEIANALNGAKLKMAFESGNQKIYIEDVDYSTLVFNSECGMLASVYSQNAIIRQLVEKIQQSFAEKNSIVVEGRDIGTKVFPNADFKFFITCSLEERARRRYEDLKQTDKDITLESVKQTLQERDIKDSTREISPLVKADDAIEIDTTFDTEDQTLQKILKIIRG